MKTLKFAKYMAAGLVALSLTQLTCSCSDYLDKEPDTELDTDMVFSNRDKVYGWLATVYNVIHKPDKWSLTTDGYEIMADDVVASERWRQWDWNEVISKITGSWTVNSTWGGDLWARMPLFVRHGLIFQQKIHAMPDNDLPQTEVDNMKNEVKFLCAYAWWLMAENYGGVPFTGNEIAATDGNIENLMVGQSKFDDVVDYCDKEMLEAANALPAIYTDDTKYGRINKIMALTVRSRMLLFAASPLVNGNKKFADEYAKYVNDKGEQIFNPVYDHNKWIKAAEACKLCIDEAEKAGYALYVEKNPDGTIDPFMSTYNVHIKKWNEGNREITFPVTKGNDYHGTFLRVTSVREYGGGNGLGVYQGLVDAFFTKNGLPIDDPNSGYQENKADGTPIYSTKVDDRSDITSWNFGSGKSGEPGDPGIITGKGIYAMYCNREPRFYNAVSFHGSRLCIPKGERAYDFLYNGRDNIQSSSPHDAPQNGYLARKSLCVTDNYKEGTVTSRQGFTYRLAFTYLDYAEAVNEAYDDAAKRLDAIKYVNLIRERAGVRKYTFDAVDVDDPDYIHIDNTQEAVRKVVYMERRVELCCENNRWFDIRRLMLAESIPEMNGFCMGMNAQADNKAEFFKRTPSDLKRVWRPAYYWMPIYYQEADKNPKLKQPPFWDKAAGEEDSDDAEAEKE